ncbi:MAG TPA: phosphoadenylyl-sulfate reductase [Pseudonocardiaceae bacterium]|nr:phosphoadenylyl-sulfate reductase [Pseudonocardiaceae bacterium]
MRTKPSVLQTIAEHAADEFADADALTILTWTTALFTDRWVVASNLQDAVLIDLAASVQPNVSVVFLDTGYHFAETIGTRDAVAAAYPDVRILNATPDMTVAEQESAYGLLHVSDPDRCCRLRKVLPLQRVLADYYVWVTGVRRADSPGRANMPKISWDRRHGLIKINPIADWSDEQFDEYIAEHGILVNPLVSAGYPSIGCAPCTAKPLPGADNRSGRWSGQAKTECGLHG